MSSHPRNPTLARRIATLAGGLTLVLLVARPAQGQVCGEDADCGADFRCAKSCSSPGCSTPPNCPPPTVTCSETGTCEPKYRTCAADGDCPMGLTCRPGPDGVCSRLPSGETMCTEGTKVCTFVQQRCTEDAQCGTGSECVNVGITGCGAIFIPDAGPCESTEVRACFPRRQRCQQDGDCSAGATCFDFADSRSGQPSFWGTDAPGKACIPEALAFTLRGHAYLDGPGLSGGGVPTSGEGGGGTGHSTAPNGGVTRENRGSGCAVALATPSVPSPWALVLGALAFALVRRIRR